ncbi:hypothetical protein HMPREF9241_01665 [Schaalia turicensis ACS-279-V-Col4]|uniref:HTH cro/C1-type domain-containing protein n=1 Tax=Schaalia turicensis ACS-279-V-Col4 TaxID=883077 RepID=K0YYY4_9ACTO|nr:helix-turn-helix transcriptional regulator [Schaalia turicensis]EJZ84889.1 hypothetical protein HMPREF9241_01665 [Schaalia turicensis ACS-279-V-Col4]
MDIFDELGIDVTDEGTINAINMYSQLRQVTRDLVKIRKERGLRQQDIADELMISRQAVAKIEDPSGNPKISTLITYAIAVDAAIEIKVKKRQWLELDFMLQSDQASEETIKEFWGSSRRTTKSSRTGITV